MIKKIINTIIGITGFHLESKNIERQAIIEAKKYFGDKEIVACEIGTFKGKHALNMFRHLNIKKLYIIDPYEDYDGYSKDLTSKEVSEAEANAQKLLKKYSGNIVWIKKYSNDALEDIKEELDFLYIDGNHYSPYIDEDIKNYYPKVKVNGIISGHDYQTGWGDVMEAVFNFSKKINKAPIIGAGTDWTFIKPVKEETK